MILFGFISDTEECTWYTFVGGDNFCSLLQSCTEVNEDTCGTCVSGRLLQMIVNYIFLPDFSMYYMIIA